MNSANTRLVLEGLELMARCEAAVGGFYQACATTWPGDGALWSRLAEEETIHEVRLELLRERVRANAKSAQLLRIFPARATRTFIDGVNTNRELVLAGKITAAAALSLARGLELALLESKALHTVSFDDPFWQDYLRAIIAETEDHAQRIETRLGQDLAAAPQRV